MPQRTRRSCGWARILVTRSSAMSCRPTMRPVVALLWASSPSTVVQIQTPHWNDRHRNSFNYSFAYMLYICYFYLFGYARCTYRNTENTRAILPIARILFRMTSLRRFAVFSVRSRWKTQIKRQMFETLVLVLFSDAKNYTIRIT